MTIGTRRDAILFAIEQFYYREARVLDQGEYALWLQMLADDIIYSIPQTEFVDRPDTSLDFVGAHHFRETKASLTSRALYLSNDLNPSEAPASNKTRFISNVEVLEGDDASAEVASNFMLWQTRWDGVCDVIIGRRQDRLRMERDDWRIAARNIHLDASLLPRTVTTFF